MKVELLIWISIVLHIATSAFLLWVTFYTYRQMKKTTAFVQKTIIIGVEKGTKQLEAALNDAKTYDYLISAVEKRIVQQMNAFATFSDETWKARMVEMQAHVSDVVGMVQALPDSGGKDESPIQAVLTGFIQAMTHKRGPVGYLNENAPKVAKTATGLYQKWKASQPIKVVEKSVNAVPDVAAGAEPKK